MARPKADRCVALRLLAVALLFVFALSAPSSARTLLHKHAPRFVRVDLHGQQIDLAGFKGKVVLLTFWATWCAPCQIEMPRFIEWQNRYGPQGLQIVAVSMDDSDAPVRALTTQLGVNYPIVMGDANLARLYGGILGLPTTFIITPNGKIAAEFKGETDLDTIAHALATHLAPRR